MLVKGQMKDPFSLRSCYLPDVKIDKAYIETLYELSRSKYSRPLAEAKKMLEEKQADVIQTIEDFNEPII